MLNNIAVPKTISRWYIEILYALLVQTSGLYKKGYSKLNVHAPVVLVSSSTASVLCNFKSPVENRNLHDRPQLHHDYPRLVTSNGVATLSWSVGILRVSQLSARDRSESRRVLGDRYDRTPRYLSRPLVAYANRVFVLQKGTWFFYVGEHDSLVSRPLVRHVGQPRVWTGSGDDEKTPPLTGHVSQLSRPYRNRHLADQIQLQRILTFCL